MGLGTLGGIAGGLIAGVPGVIAGAGIGNVMKGSGSGAYYTDAKNNLLDTQNLIKTTTQQERDRLLANAGSLQAPTAGEVPVAEAAVGSSAGTLAQLGILSPFMNESMDGFGQQFTGAGAQATALSSLRALNQNPSAILEDPLFLAQQEAGIRGAEMGAASRGTQLSGGQLANLQQLSQQTAADVLQKRQQSLATEAGVGAGLAQTGQSLANLGGNIASTSANIAAGAEQAFGLQNLVNQQQVNKSNQDAALQYGLANLSSQQQTNQQKLGYDQLIANQSTAGLNLQSDVGGSLASLSANIGASKDASKAQQQSGVMGLIGTGLGALAGM